MAEIAENPVTEDEIALTEKAAGHVRRLMAESVVPEGHGLLL